MKFGGLINKKSKTMWISIIFICFFLLLLLVVVPATKFNEKGEGLKSIESLKRPDAGEGKKEYELIVDYNGERKETYCRYCGCGPGGPHCRIRTAEKHGYQTPYH